MILSRCKCVTITNLRFVDVHRYAGMLHAEKNMGSHVTLKHGINFITPPRMQHMIYEASFQPSLSVEFWKGLLFILHYYFGDRQLLKQPVKERKRSKCMFLINTFGVYDVYYYWIEWETEGKFTCILHNFITSVPCRSLHTA